MPVWEKYSKIKFKCISLADALLYGDLTYREHCTYMYFEDMLAQEISGTCIK
jgi:hypothetical protein